MEKCAYENCEEEATTLACGRKEYPWNKERKREHPTVAKYCPIHAYEVADERSPEYHTECPNCGCKFGVN